MLANGEQFTFFQLALTNSCVPTGWYKLLLILLTTVNGSNVSIAIKYTVNMNIS